MAPGKAGVGKSLAGLGFGMLNLSGILRLGEAILGRN